MILTLLSALLIGCGGGGGTIISEEDIAIAKIAAYATGESDKKPSVEDYHYAGMEVANSDNINAINEYIRDTRSDNPEDWIEDTDGDGVIDAIDGAPDDATKSNNMPVATGAQISVTYETTKQIVLSASDIDGDTLSYTRTSTPSHGVLSGTAPNLTYTPDADYTGSDHFDFKVSDGIDDSSIATITIEVGADPDAIYITENYQVERLGKGGVLQKTIKLGSAYKNLYILLTNSDKSEASNPTITHNAKITLAKKIKRTLPRDTISSHQKILHAPAYITSFNRGLHKRENNRKDKLLPTAIKYNKDVAGDTKEFYLDEYNTNNKTAATAKKVVTVTTAFGDKTLNIWVSDDSFGAGCEKVTCVTQDMVEALADTFLKADSDNDIYDWVTNIYGEEWGDYAADTYSNLIGTDDEITILLTDIDNDNSKNGGVIGYFYPKDNYTTDTTSGSNQRVMFYIDSVMFANTDSGDTWQKEVYSTLAHEFTHMIEFYQKFIKLDSEHDDWIAEMLAETTEDLVATKIEHNGPRNVAYTDGTAGDPNNVNGRYPKFNENPALSLTTWNYTIEDYSKVSAFGTFLTRNYGGAKVLHDIMHTAKENEDLLESVTGKNFASLLREWGVAVMLSDVESPEDLPTYNTGNFTEDHYGNSTYQLGSINFFNYIPKPVTSEETGTVETEGNYYYEIGDSLTGDITIDLALDDNTEATLIAKEVRN